MSRLPGPDEGWLESTEGDLDPDLTDEAGSGLHDWERPYRPSVLVLLARVAMGVALAALVLSLFARALF